jgi:2-amino-4-hydroxy-6-hydroxymethyldihydropteridine diphosphokinase
LTSIFARFYAGAARVICTGVAICLWKTHPVFVTIQPGGSAASRPCENLGVKKTAYLGLGSNLGDREANLRRALEELRKLGEITALSSLYETDPVGVTAQPWFLNAAVALETELMPKQLLAATLAIERSMGRRRNQPSNQPKGPRTIDIDILLFGSAVVEAPGLTIPHEAMHERRFVLEPLTEVAPDAMHPVLKRAIRELRDALPAGPAVKRIGKL